MTTITPATVLQRRSDVRYRRIEGEAVVLRQAAAEVLVLNEVGAAVLDLADGERSVGDWIEALAADVLHDDRVLVGVRQVEVSSPQLGCLYHRAGDREIERPPRGSTSIFPGGRENTEGSR